MRGSIGLCHLWVRPYFSSSIPYNLLHTKKTISNTFYDLIKWRNTDRRSVNPRTCNRQLYNIAYIDKNTEKYLGERKRVTETWLKWKPKVTKWVKKSRRGRKKNCEHRRQRWHINTTTRRLHRKVRTRTDYRHQKWYWQHDRRQNDNN